jgi:hypothetical protein
MSKWKEKLNKLPSTKEPTKEEPPPKKRVPLKSLEQYNQPPTTPSSPPFNSEIPDYIKKELGDDTIVEIEPPSAPLKVPKRPIERISDFETPETAWLSSDKLRVISFLVFKTTSRQRINEISQDLAKVFLAILPPDEAKRIAQAFLQFLEQQEARNQGSPRSI